MYKMIWEVSIIFSVALQTAKQGLFEENWFNQLAEFVRDQFRKYFSQCGLNFDLSPFWVEPGSRLDCAERPPSDLGDLIIGLHEEEAVRGRDLVEVQGGELALKDNEISIKFSSLSHLSFLIKFFPISLS